MKRLQTAQNIAIRKFFHHDYFVEDLSTADIYRKYKILNVQQLIYVSKILLIYKIDKNLLKSNYLVQRHNHDRNSRAHIRLSAYRTNVGRFSIYRACTELFQDEQNNLQTNRSLNTFKKTLKTMALERRFDVIWSWLYLTSHSLNFINLLNINTKLLTQFYF